MNIIISDKYGNRRKVSNEPDRINLILNISGRKNISDKPDNINSIISVPRSKIPMPDNKKKNLLPTKNIKGPKPSKPEKKPVGKDKLLEKKPIDKDKILTKNEKSAERNMNIERMRLEALKSPCKVIKFSASDGKNYSHNGEFYANCMHCKRTEIVQQYPNCKANHAEWGILAKSTDVSKIYIYCMTPDGKDYPFNRFWCQICAILLPMFGAKDVFMWNGEWIRHDPKKLIEEKT